MIDREKFGLPNFRRILGGFYRRSMVRGRKALRSRNPLIRPMYDYAAMTEKYLGEARGMAGQKPMNWSRRKHERFSANFPVRVKVWASGESQEGTCRNLSQGGLLLEVAELLPEGTRVLVELDLQHVGQFVCVQADVVWGLDFPPEARKRPSMGLRFTEMDEEPEALLNKIIDRMAGRGDSEAIPQPKP